MTRILFTHSYFLHLDPKQEEAANAYPPIGTLFAASFLRENGFTISLFDSMLAKGPQEIVPFLEKAVPEIVIIYDDGFNYLTKMCLSNMREAAFEMIKEAKKRNCITIISSSDSNDHYEKYLKTGADYVILGEGELTLLELVKGLESGKEIIDLPGLAYMKDGQIKTNHRRPVLKDLDQLPLPAWDILPLDGYREIWKKQFGYFSLNIATTRGCPYKCNWCAKPLFGNRYHARSPFHVVEEWQMLVEKFGAQHIWVADDIFGLKPGWIAEFADLVNERNIRIPFKIQSRADLLIQENTVKDLARAGCQEVWIGAESGSQKILDAMEKGIKLEQIKKARQLLKEHGIRTAFFIQFGYPGEGIEEIEETFELVKTLLPDEIGVSVSYPLPGTPFFEKVKDQLKEKTNWTDSDDLDMMFENSFPKGFYKDLQRYLHRVFRREKSWYYLKVGIKNPFSLRMSEWFLALKAFYWIPFFLLKPQSVAQLTKRYGKGGI